MIILYDTNEQAFTTLGLGVLKDTISCEVKEELNGSYELEMEYPITGSHYSEIQVGKLVLTKSNPYDTIGEPFRIYKITKPINGIVTISAQHLSYDLSGYTVEPFKGTDLDDTLSKIQNGTIIQSPFTFIRGTDKENVQTEFEIKQPYSQRGILAGSEGSILDVYRGEFIFSRFNVTLCNHRGADRGICIRYGKNMTEVEQEINNEKGYTGVYPYYANTVTETKTEESMVYEQVYIVAESDPFSKDWLSLSDGPNNKPLLPILHDTPVQCATEGNYYQHIFIWHTVINEITGESHDEYVDVTSTAATDYPPNRKSVDTYNEESYEFITLTEKVIYINEQSTHQNILTLDLTSDFNDVPTEEQLRNKATSYITNNKLGQPTSTIKVSFVKLSDSPEYEQFKSLETVKLGDTVKVEYVALGISTSLQVISYTYNAITNLYSEIELGTKTSTLSETVLTAGDTISSLTNDKGYTDKTTVNELIAKMITADYIEALSATFTEVQIKELLTTDTIRTRIIEASQFDIDYLVAEKLVANDAEIYDTLTAGNIKVRGDIDVLAGSITISGTPTPTNGYLNADSTVEIYSEDWLCSDATGLTPIIPSDGNFYICKNTGTEYYNKVYRYLNERYEEWTGNTTFEVDPYGNVYANSVELTGYIRATAGEIGGAQIIDGQLHVPVAFIDGTIYADAIKLDYNSTYGGYNVSIDGNGIYVGITGQNTYNFSVDDDGIITIKRGSINLGYNGTGYNFTVDDDGNVYASSLELAGGSINIEAITVLCEENSSVEPYTRNWLKNASTHTTIIPKEYVNYLLEGYEVTATFGTSGNYKSVLYNELEDSQLTEHVDYEDNSTDNTQFKEGRVLKVHVLEGGYITLTGYPNYSHYTFTVNGVTTSELNGTNTSATATSEQDILITALTSNNYYISLFVKNTEDQYFKWNGTQYEKTYRIPSSFEVDEFGTLTTNNANIKGHIEATAGEIGGCTIQNGKLIIPAETNISGTISANAINLGNGQFTVDTNGEVVIKDGRLRLGYNSQYQYYNIEIDSYGINLGYDRTNDYYNFVVDDDGNVTIRKGSISIKRNMTTISATINTSASATYASDWLKDSTGTTVITPDSTKYYYITSWGTYIHKIFKWDTLNSMYYEVYSSSETFFEVDEDGNVKANSLVVTSGIIGGCEIVNGELTVKTANIEGTINANDINLGSGNFVVDTSGNVTIKYGSILMGKETAPKVYLWYNSWTSSYPTPLSDDWLNPWSATNLLPFYVSSLSYDDNIVVQVDSNDEYDGRYFKKDPNDNTKWIETTSADLRPNVIISDDTFEIRSGEIKLGLSQRFSGYNLIRDYNFMVDDTGEVTMKKGSISLGYNSSISDYNFSVDDTGELHATSGYVGNFYLNPNWITTNVNKSYGDNNEGMFLADSGLYFCSSNGYKASISAGTGIKAKWVTVDFNNVGDSFPGTQPILSLNVSEQITSDNYTQLVGGGYNRVNYMFIINTQIVVKSGATGTIEFASNSDLNNFTIVSVFASETPLNGRHDTYQNIACEFNNTSKQIYVYNSSDHDIHAFVLILLSKSYI